MKNRLALAALVVALGVAAALAFFAIEKRPPPHSPEHLVPTTWSDARETPMHRFHVGEKKIACTECHGTAETPGASPEAAAASCTKCHEHERNFGHVRGKDPPKHAETPCLTCHVFGANKPEATCNECHATDHRAPAAPALDHHASQGIACTACHSIHGVERVVLADCTTCHEKVSAIHGRFEAHGPAPGSTDAASLGSGEVCSACHAPHSGKEAARARCTDCHVGAHGARGSTLDAAAPRVVPQGPRVAGHEGCPTCHEAHRARRADVRPCRSCHADHVGATSIAGHAECTGCHSPHAPASAQSSCVSSGCHAQKLTLGTAPTSPGHAAGSPHANCTSCHDPHRPERAAGEACAGCHATTTPSHPAFSSKSGPRACTGCHEPHPAKAREDAAVSRIAVACTHCHDSIRATDHAPHSKTLTCTNCHTPHGFELASRGAAVCARCHADRAAETATRRGHARCSDCHQSAHAPIAKPTCERCHAEEVRTAPRGHAMCTSCHDAHSGALGSHASCTSCHENKVKALHGNLAQGCASCHRPHGHAGGPPTLERPPACASCHRQPSLQGLHDKRAHTTCGTCHVAHGPPRSDRATCTNTCHTDRRAHQPEAKVCSGCHIFRE